MASNPMVSLASSVHAGPSTFALLVGSGISSGAGVPSGWEMTVDLIRRLAALHGQDAGADPAWTSGATALLMSRCIRWCGLARRT